MNLFLSKGRALALKKYLARRSDDREGVDTLFPPVLDRRGLEPAAWIGTGG